MCTKKSTLDESIRNTSIPIINLEKNIFKVYTIDKYVGKTKDFIENERFEVK